MWLCAGCPKIIGTISFFNRINHVQLLNNFFLESVISKDSLRKVANILENTDSHACFKII